MYSLIWHDLHPNTFIPDWTSWEDVKQETKHCCGWRLFLGSHLAGQQHCLPMPPHALQHYYLTARTLLQTYYFLPLPAPAATKPVGLLCLTSLHPCMYGISHASEPTLPPSLSTHHTLPPPYLPHTHTTTMCGCLQAWWVLFGTGLNFAFIPRYYYYYGIMLACLGLKLLSVPIYTRNMACGTDVYVRTGSAHAQKRHAVPPPASIGRGKAATASRTPA